MNLTVDTEMRYRAKPYPGLNDAPFHMNPWYDYIARAQMLLAQRKERRKAETHKTVPCQAWKDTGRCNYGRRCKFAHGAEELRPMPKAAVKLYNNPRYRTALCTKYATFGCCPYGDQCHFIHDPDPIDLEKCLDCLSPLSTPAVSPKQTSAQQDVVSLSGTEVETEATQFDYWKEQNIETTSESDSLPVTESMQETESEDDPLPWDPFRTDNTYAQQIEFRPLHFDPYPLLYLINPPGVLPQKQ